MTTRTPKTDHDAHPYLRVIQGGLASPRAQQEDEPARAKAIAALREEMAAAALLADLLEQEGLRIAFEDDPVGDRVRARVQDEAGRFSRELPLRHVVDPLNFDPFTGASH
ncbi:MAG: hypothetical protein J7513_05565 [Solirubrobacteraceae bacterium]|nr:hypothetical protein [Solirubrobacteraceae bacterium]